MNTNASTTDKDSQQQKENLPKIKYLAKQNERNLKSKYNGIVSGNPKASIIEDNIRYIIENLFTSYNKNTNYLIDAFNNGYLIVTYRGLSEVNSLSEVEKKYAILKVIFSGSFVDGEKFFYMALNCGNDGLESFGPHCLKINKNYTEILTESAILKNNSLKQEAGECIYFEEQNTKICIKKLSRDLGLFYSNVAHLIATKHHDKLEKISDKKLLADLILDKTSLDYIEFITTDKVELTVDSVKEVTLVEYRTQTKNFTKGYFNELIDEDDGTKVQQIASGESKKIGGLINLLNSKKIKSTFKRIDI